MRIISNEQTMLESEQEQLLNAALKVVKDESFQMKRSLDRNELMEGLKHAAAMLSELRTAVLSPKFYYRLYVDVTNEMQQHLLAYLCDNFLGEGGNTVIDNGTIDPDGDKNSKKVAELYETVQYTGNIIPRLYLLITVGVVYIKSGECPAADILRDLVEMCRGVQHPLRGLFLRNYLLTSTKELIPDIKSTLPTTSNTLQADTSSIGETSVTEAPGNVAIEFIMTNFSEMNKLWVRMQHQGPSREREKRERERRELRILVGTNLVRLSQLESLDLETYRRMVLPGILEQSVSCREPISQEYLMECVIQVFPDNYHLSTLHEFLDACADLHEQVHIKNILGTLIDHLAQFAIAEDSPGIPADLQLFDIFSQHAEQVIVSRTGVMPAEDVISIQIALLNLALTCYPDRPEFANCVFATTATLFKKMEISSVTFNSVIGRELVKLLKIPLDHYKNVINLLRLENYGDVLAAFDYKGRTHVASAIINSMIENETTIEEEEQVEKIFSIITSLLVDQPDQPKDSSLDAMALEDFEEEQNLVAKLVHLIYNEDLEIHFKLLNKIRKSFGLGGMARLRHTLPATIFSTYKLLLRYHDAKSELTDFDTRVGKLFHFCMDTINALRMQAEMPEIALRFYLQSALVSDRISFDKSSSVTYEFVSKAFAIYEEDISESREQVQSLTLLLATIQRICQLPEESHEPLRNQCALYASKLIKRPDQARMVCLVARVFWFSKVSNSEEPLKDGQRVVECLKKAIKIASQCMEDLVQITLYVHILSTYVHFFEIGCDKISPETINQMIDKIRDSLLQLDPSPEADQLNEIFTALINRLRENQQNPPADSQVSYAGFVLYLLITVGVVYIKSGVCPVADNLRDLVEMCRGVQGPSREREKRERERRELRILVGTNLVRLSQLESLDLETYRRMVLPGILEQSVSCREPISQEYLMECVIQVFPDSYHLSTLHEFLDACADLHEQVHIKNILGTLIDHLAQFLIAENSPGIPVDLQLFDIFSEHAEQVIVSRTGVMPAEDVISIQIALLNLALTCYPERPEFANCVFATTATLFKKMDISSVTFNSVIGRELVKLLKIPLDHYKNVINLLRLENYGDVLAAFDYKGRTHVASAIINSMIENETVIEEEEQVEKIFSIIKSLLVDQADQPKDSSLDAMALEDFEDEQNLVAKLVYLIYNEDLETHFKLLNKIRKSFGLGGMARLRHTLPATIFSTYKLLLRYHDAKSELTDFDTRVGKLFHFCMGTINALRIQAEMPEIALRFYLQSALVSDRISFDKSSSVTYEFVSKHPLRGLFLRNYLLTSTKELIPDIKSTLPTTSNTLQADTSSIGETSVTEAPGNVAIEEEIEIP